METLYVPVGHGLHEDDPTLCGLKPYVPAAHCRHTDFPPSMVYVPIGHGVQLALAPSVAEKYPASQGVHTLSDCAPRTVLNFPLPHFRHALGEFDPVLGLYVPGGHCVHEYAAPVFSL